MWALHPLPSRSTFHFSLFTFHFPKGALFTIHFSLFTSHRDTFHFPQGPLFTIHSSLFTSRRDTFHFCHAVRCVGSRSVLHWLLQRAALGIAAHCVFWRSLVAVFCDSAVCTFLSLFMKRCCVVSGITQHFSRFHRVFSCECRRRMTGASYGAHPVILLSFLI